MSEVEQIEEDDDDVAGIVAEHANDPPPKKKRRGRSRSEESNGNGGGNGNGEAAPVSKTLEDLDVDELLARELPKPAENVKSLGDLMAKYDIGNRPEFKLQVWRTYPKIGPGGTKLDGFYDTWDQPLTEDLMQSEYGGGGYRVVVMGPHPSKPNSWKHYDSCAVQLAGEPKYSRQPLALQKGAATLTDAVPPPPPMYQQEAPKLSETAMKMAVDIADREREERRRVEDRSAAALAQASQASQPLAEAERRRADDLIKSTEDRYLAEQRLLLERLTEERDERRATERKLEALMAEIQGSRVSAVTEAASLAREMVSMSRPSGDEGKAAERMMESVLSKHTAELESMRTGHQQMLDSVNRQHAESVAAMRQAHSSEITSLREASLREIASERDAGGRRVERVEDQLKIERDERRRDQDRHREVLEERDRAWKDRVEAQISATNQSWEARHQSVVGSHENRALWLQQEIDRLKSDLVDAKSRLTDNSDPIAIVQKAKELKEAMGVTEPAPGGGGIGMGKSDDWKDIAAEELAARAPQILGVLGNLLGGQQPGAQQPQQFQPGQVVNTAQGEMVVIQTPQGLALTPKAAVDAAQQQAQGRMLPQQGQQRRRVMPDAEEVVNQGGGAGRRRRRPTAVPNFADAKFGDDGKALKIRRRPAWEEDDDGGGEAEELPDRTAQPQQQRPAPAQGQQPATQQSQQQPQQRRPAESRNERISRQMNPQERQAINVIAKMVHDAVMSAEEPDEFADKVMKEWSPDILRRVVSGYSPDDIAKAIAETHPQSGGATPAGQKFARDLFEHIEDALEDA